MVLSTWALRAAPLHTASYAILDSHDGVCCNRLKHSTGCKIPITPLYYRASLPHPLGAKDLTNASANTDGNARRRNRILLWAVILGTLPFYCVGGVLYLLAPADRAPLPTAIPSATREFTDPSFTATLRPTDLVAASITPVSTLVATPQGGLLTQPTIASPATRTQTPLPSPTLAVPTATPIPTDIPLPTQTPLPVASDTPIPFNN